MYIEPHVPQRSLVVVGYGPVADALARLAAMLDYAVVRVVVDEELRDIAGSSGARVLALGALRHFLDELDANARRRLVAIVASQGHYDEIALEALLAVDVAFVGLLASRRRAASVTGILAQAGISPERLALIHNPVGLDIGARSPGEVAVSILAEMIALTPALSDGEDAPLARAASPSAVDPVCGMDVDASTSLHRFEHDAKTYCFCCAGCRGSFATDPARYLAISGSA